jgi:hypothetical protein
LPPSRRSARCFRFPPRQRTRWMRLTPSLVMAGWRPVSYFFFFWCGWRRPPVSRRLWRLSRVIAAGGRGARAGRRAVAAARGRARARARTSAQPRHARTMCGRARDTRGKARARARARTHPP